MTVERMIVHKVRNGETLSSLVNAYRLSSASAILDIDKNDAIRSKLMVDCELPVDLFVNIPPNAEDLLQERMVKLNELKPVLLMHFDTMMQLAETKLYPLLSKGTHPFNAPEVTVALGNLGEFVGEGIEQIGANTTKLAELGIAMSLTHVATADERELSASPRHPAVGLTWAVSPDGLALWKSMWSRALWDEKWVSSSVESAIRFTMQYITTVGSIVVQRGDQRFRESLLLRRKLQAES